MATTTLTKRIAELEAEIERLAAAAATSRPLRRRLGGKLSDRKLKTFNRPGRIIGDGNNLLYKCGGLGHGCFLYRYKARGKAYDIGLGGYPAVSLLDARIARDEHNRLRNQGQDPADERRQQKLAQRLVRAKAMTFRQCADGRELWIAEYHDLSAAKPGLFGFLVARAEAQVLRLAMTYALLDQTYYIEAAHLRAALAFWQYCEASTRYIFRDMLGDAVADELLAALRQVGPDGMRRSDISELFGRNRSADRISAALVLLLKNGKIRRRQKRGFGSPEVWAAV